MRIFAIVTVFGLAAGSLAPLHGQSLVDVAKKEGERRQGVKGEAKVYTNGDLKPVSDPSAGPDYGGGCSRRHAGVSRQETV